MTKGRNVFLFPSSMLPATPTSTSTLTPSRWLVTRAGQWHSIPARRFARHVSQADVTAPETVISALPATPSQLLGRNPWHYCVRIQRRARQSVGRAQVSFWGMRRPQPTQNHLGSSSMHSSACFSYRTADITEYRISHFYWYFVPLPRGQLYDTG
ncbi:hypothetical protein V8C40DRAFT_280936 [Trichoderma camerunense]